MTVHGAKGLEAPIVILADTTTPPAGPRSASRGCCRCRRRTCAGHAGPAGLGRPQGQRRRADRGARASARAPKREDEYRRLLYVAMTRADRPADRLRHRRRAQAARRAAGTNSCSTRCKPIAVDGAGRRRRRRRCGAIARRRAERAAAPRQPMRRPSRRRRCRAGSSATRRASRPRRAAHAVALRRRCTRRRASPSAEAPTQQALARGTHRAPADAVAARHPAGAARRGRAALSRARAPELRRRPSATTIIAQGAGRCSTIRASPRCSRPAAAPKCRSSAASHRAGPAVSGQVDRLVVTDRGRADRRLQDQPSGAAPACEDVPPAYVAPARALPRRARASSIPTAPIRAALVWTDVPDLMEISGRQRWMRRWPSSPPRERALTLRGRRSIRSGRSEVPAPAPTRQQRGVPWPLARCRTRLSRPRC